MEIRMESKEGTVLTGIDPVLGEIRQRLEAHPKEWLKTLEQSPGDLANLEKEIHRTFAQMADRVVAGLFAPTTADPGLSRTPQKKKIPPPPRRKRLGARGGAPTRALLGGCVTIWI